MSAHTPGPWAIATRGAIEIATLHGVYRRPSEDGLGQGWVYVVADKGRDWRAMEDGEQEANARLIAAAPDLLAAVTMIRDADDDCRHDGLPTIPGPARAVIDAAIAKAEGRS